MKRTENRFGESYQNKSTAATHRPKSYRQGRIQTTFPATQTSEMSSTKRKAPDVELQRRVRVRRESSEELESVPSLNGDDPAEDHSENSDPDSDSNSEEDQVCLCSESQNRLVANP